METAKRAGGRDLLSPPPLLAVPREATPTLAPQAGPGSSWVLFVVCPTPAKPVSSCPLSAPAPAPHTSSWSSESQPLRASIHPSSETPAPTGQRPSSGLGVSGLDPLFLWATQKHLPPRPLSASVPEETGLPLLENILIKCPMK